MSSEELVVDEPVRYPRRALGVGAFVAALAAPVGFWAFMVPMALYSAVTDGVSLDGLVAAPKNMVLGALFSFVIGGVPALISAVVSGWMVWRQGTLSYVQAAVIAGGAGALYVGAMEVQTIAQGGKPELGILGMIGGLSLVSAVICRWAMGRIGILPVGSREVSKS